MAFEQLMAEAAAKKETKSDKDKKKHKHHEKEKAWITSQLTSLPIIQYWGLKIFPVLEWVIQGLIIHERLYISCHITTHGALLLWCLSSHLFFLSISFNLAISIDSLLDLKWQVYGLGWWFCVKKKYWRWRIGSSVIRGVERVSICNSCWARGWRYGGASAILSPSVSIVTSQVLLASSYRLWIEFQRIWSESVVSP